MAESWTQILHLAARVRLRGDDAGGDDRSIYPFSFATFLLRFNDLTSFFLFLISLLFLYSCADCTHSRFLSSISQQL